MITTRLYQTTAEIMARLGLQPISQEEILANRRSIFPTGRRKTDSLGSFILDHLILDAIEVLVLVLAYSIIRSYINR